MHFKKNLTLLIIFQILIFSIFITPSFSEKKTTLVDLLPGVKTKSPLLKLPRKLGNGSIITFTSYDAYEFKQILNGLHKSNPIKVTGHLTFPVGDGTTSGNVPVIIILHGNGGPYEFLDRQTSWFQDIQKSLLKAGIGVFYIDSFTGRGVENSY